ncbi:hypothetical protein AB8Q18_11440 [Neisseriaceae bacterium CLB008]
MSTLGVVGTLRFTHPTRRSIIQGLAASAVVVTEHDAYVLMGNGNVYILIG